MQLIPTKWNESDRALVVPEHAISPRESELIEPVDEYDVSENY